MTRPERIEYLAGTGRNELSECHNIGNLVPADYAKLSASASQRDGTLRAIGGVAPRPVAAPSQAGSNGQSTLLIGG
jgi:hypothetical protein